MSTHPTPAPRSLLVRFCDSFLQERNIKWMLAAGMVILLGSSLLLVSVRWDQYTPIWKYLIFLAYSVAIFGAGEMSQHRLALRRTATMLQALTVLLIPISFLVLRWHLQNASLVEQGAHLLLFGVNLAFSVFAAGRVFHYFLRGHQPTFLASFLMLSLAGTYVPGLPAEWAPGVALALWAVFAVGSVKVNRHVFWLIEEQRAPRIFGFFPIMLLGAQFLMLFVLHAPAEMSLAWLGLGSALVAVPVLLTADAVARVFQQRTGDLVRPWPWAIIGPLTLGLVLCWAGVCLAGASVVPPSKPYALVLTAGLAAVMMGIAARRTGKHGFVWAMLLGVMLTYNFSPAFFIEWVRVLLDHGARMVHEPRLPIPFYGLTYLPLILGVMTLSWWRMGDRRVALLTTDGLGSPSHGSELFSRPLRLFSIGLGCLMLAVSLGHVKALFPVALCMTAVFALQVLLFREGRLALLAIAAWIVASAGFAPFAESVLGWTLPVHAEMIFLIIGTGILLLAGNLLDRRIARLMPETFKRDEDALLAGIGMTPRCLVSLLLTVGLAVYWFVFLLAAPVREAMTVSVCLAGLMAIQALRMQQRPTRLFALVLLNLQVLSLTALAVCPAQQSLFDQVRHDVVTLCLPLALAASLSLALWQGFEKTWRSSPELVDVLLLALRVLGILAVTRTLKLTSLSAAEAGLAGAAFLLAVFGELSTACRRQHEDRVWSAEVLAFAGIGYFVWFGVIPLGHGIAMFVVLGVGLSLWVLGEGVRGWEKLSILTQPLQRTALVMPMTTVVLGVYRHLADDPVFLGASSLALFLAAGFYFWRGIERSSKPFLMLAGLILNVALILLWRDLVRSDPQFFMIPIGLSILALVQLLKQEIPERFHDPLRYLGALVILVSPVFHIIQGGSWIPLFSLMVVSVGVLLLAIGLRVRALMYAGSAFLLADLVAMLVRGSIDNVNVLWIAGLILGSAVIALGALCERHREVLVQRMRVLSEALQQWQ